ncbi:RICIN domain-containing protein [Streptomyces sp. NBC_00154]|uniref:RICIN domain-containing protein n=1 Tax=Streptomyces sp. NBC_00154 TaxID=2975670 RepID=UPI002256C744|nr:RICIN domain-containing protein [Streptomyces sp. NBC_00154]MCX5314633.1 RICIN domain-containing protein [Streptomyces sp. NBC_00154]
MAGRDATGEAVRVLLRPRLVPGATAGGVHVGKARPALGVAYCGVVYFTWHGAAQGGTDNVTVLRNIEERMANAGPDRKALRWAVLGEYNMETHGTGGLAEALGPDLPTYQLLPPNAPTRPVTGRSIDYAVTGKVEPPIHSGYGLGTVMTDFELSDHRPVEYDFSYLTDDPTCVPAEQPKPRKTVPSKRQVLTSAATTRSPYPTSLSATSRLKFRKVTQQSLGDHSFQLQAAPGHPGHYRVLHNSTRTYLGQEGGTPDAQAILLGYDDGDSQLWRPLDMGDGTWVLMNLATGQALTTERDDGEELVGRDLVDDFDPDQRWFFQDAESEALDVDRIVTVAGSAATVEGADPLEGSPVRLEPERSDDSTTEEFTVIAVNPGESRTDGNSCYYLVHGDLYVNSTATNPQVSEGNQLTLNKFRANDTGYQFCTRLADRHETVAAPVLQYDNRAGFTALGALNGGLLGLGSSALTWFWEVRRS